MIRMAMIKKKKTDNAKCWRKCAMSSQVQVEAYIFTITDKKSLALSTNVKCLIPYDPEVLLLSLNK